MFYTHYVFTPFDYLVDLTVRIGEFIVTSLDGRLAFERVDEQ